MRRSRFIFLLIGLFASACRFTPGNTKVQYVPDMADSPAVKAQSSEIDPPEFSIAMDAIFYAEDSSKAELLFSNPKIANAESIARGKVHWNNVCVACHGENASGQNKFGDVYPQAPDIRTDYYREKKDGFYFHTITFGAAVMPRYGHALTEDERWDLVNYIRELQKEDAGQ